MRVLQKLSLNGMLIPNIFFSKKILLQPKNFSGDKNAIFGYKKVLYEYDALGTGYLATADSMKFFAQLWIFFKRLLKFYANYNRLRRDYESAMIELTARKFWEDVYKN